MERRLGPAQREARQRAVIGLLRALEATQAGTHLSAVDVEPIVDDLIDAARPGLSEHAEAVDRLRTQKDSTPEQERLAPSDVRD